MLVFITTHSYLQLAIRCHIILMEWEWWTQQIHKPDKLNWFGFMVKMICSLKNQLPLHMVSVALGTVNPPIPLKKTERFPLRKWHKYDHYRKTYMYFCQFVEEINDKLVSWTALMNFYTNRSWCIIYLLRSINYYTILFLFPFYHASSGCILIGLSVIGKCKRDSSIGARDELTCHTILVYCK